ncbi:hypothetical protein BKA62DRAFT_685715 [Auriculariales sp. MPI-PUGE-AT-0066]|nr:hypothetical protein BKA62DRAFT_685715 [Auriculariales sp. MPI-PUGE-AT-0066]
MAAAPPFYLMTAVSSPLTGASMLVHPGIHFQYADDAPLSLDPSTAHYTLVMDFDPTHPQNSVVHSLSPALAVSGLRVTDAQGAGADAKMYVVETMSSDSRASNESREVQTPAMMLQRFKQRNELLRRALNYPPELPTPSENEGTVEHTLEQSHISARPPSSMHPTPSRRAS